MYPHCSISPIPRRFARLLLMPGLFWLAMPLQAADARYDADHRSRIIESSLRDLSRNNDAAVARSGLSVSRGTDIQGMPRVELSPAPAPGVDALVEADVQSSLHRLRRETASQQATDDRRARIEAGQDAPVIRP